ncbi:glycosyltransferase [Salinimicrobium sp. TH3]|uniref:glycosyltransferase n=1 Tax=Salinimicrobium sp. TH3 TaxID=2997342 RepID=UPI002275F0FB|nr:glycosyltransferase family 2 protein [Salinimicrobium sp. TH3]MCY2687647.1 glycosyltransferase family 2 protein [Salinimicrobium sp. TH3]
MITKAFKLPPSASTEKFKIENKTKQQDSITEETGNEASANYKKASFTKRHLFTLAGTFLLLLGGALSVYLLQPQFEEMNMSRMDTVGGMILLFLTSFLLIFRLSFLAYISRLFFRYKPVDSVQNEELPSCTVIVPAYNEGRQVYDTLISLTNSLYPEEKLQLIAIDDGSKDDTWDWMKKAKEKLGDRVSIYQQPHNQGKRHALYRGFNMGTGEVFVTVDSDSIVEKGTLRNLVSPFVVNKDCGAVAGNVRVLNNEKAIIPRMLNVSFVFSFEFIRSAQSVLGSVLCTPGALAAYRSKAVMTCLPEWINQTFMGQPSDIGEDRAMTNMILKQGYHVLFQRNAYVLTNIPEKFSSLHKMFTRWERSNVRENLMMSKFAFKPFRTGSRSGTRLLLLNQWMHMLTAYPLVFIMLVLLVLYPVMFISSTLLSILIFSSLPAFFYAKKYNIAEAFWAYSYSIFYTFGLFWITPYAMATASRRGWLTRELPVKK